jgi:hypothetical protein
MGVAGRGAAHEEHLMNKRDVVLGVVFGVALLVLLPWMGSVISDAAEEAQRSNQPGNNLLNVVWIGLLVVALANVAAARSRIRRDHDEE